MIDVIDIIIKLLYVLIGIVFGYTIATFQFTINLNKLKEQLNELERLIK